MVSLFTLRGRGYRGGMGSRITSMIRIGVAAAVGTVVRIIFNKWGVDVDGETWTAAITGAFIGGYYSLAKWAEGRWPWLRALGLADPDNA